jgi:hypothetical protein
MNHKTVIKACVRAPFQNNANGTSDATRMLGLMRVTPAQLLLLLLLQRQVMATVTATMLNKISDFAITLVSYHAVQQQGFD